MPGRDSHVNVGLFSFLIRFPRRDVRYSYHWRLSSSSFWLVLKEQLWHGSRNSSRSVSSHFHWLLPTGRRTRVIQIIRPKSYRRKLITQSRLLSNEQLATKWTRVQCKHFVIDYFFSLIVHSPSSVAILLRKKVRLFRQGKDGPEIYTYAIQIEPADARERVTQFTFAQCIDTKKEIHSAALIRLVSEWP